MVPLVEQFHTAIIKLMLNASVGNQTLYDFAFTGIELMSTVFAQGTTTPTSWNLNTYGANPHHVDSHIVLWVP